MGDSNRIISDVRDSRLVSISLKYSERSLKRRMPADDVMGGGQTKLNRATTGAQRLLARPGDDKYACDGEREREREPTLIAGRVHCARSRGHTFTYISCRCSGCTG